MTNEEIGQVIRKERKRRKLSETKLGELSGTSRGTIVRVEKGIGIDLDLLQRIVDVLEMEITIS